MAVDILSIDYLRPSGNLKLLKDKSHLDYFVNTLSTVTTFVVGGLTGIYSCNNGPGHTVESFFLMTFRRSMAQPEGERNV